MVQPTCPKCPSTKFQATPDVKIQDALDEFTLIHCAECGAVVGVMENYSVIRALQSLASELGKPDII